jgi:hypothetical protein
MTMMMIRARRMSLLKTIAGMMIMIDHRNKNIEIEKIISKDISVKDINMKDINVKEVAKDLITLTEQPPPTDSPPPRCPLTTIPNHLCEDASLTAPTEPIPTSDLDKSLLNPLILGLICTKGHRLTIDSIEF